MKRVNGKDIARALILRLAARAEELRHKPKLTPEELKELRHLRESARSAKSLGV